MSGGKWTQENAFRFVRRLEGYLKPHYHVALAGSLLHRGFSNHDIDVMIFPHRTNHNNLEEVQGLLGSVPDMRPWIPVEAVHRQWRKLGSDDTKHVEVWRYNGRRVDVFLPYATGAS